MTPAEFIAQNRTNKAALIEVLACMAVASNGASSHAAKWYLACQCSEFAKEVERAGISLQESA